jgi:hypothetical protein
MRLYDLIVINYIKKKIFSIGFKGIIMHRFNLA